MIAKLHRAIVGLQLKDNESSHKVQVASTKIGRLEAQLFRMNKKCDEKEDLLIQVRSQAGVKIRSLFKVIQVALRI